MLAARPTSALRGELHLGERQEADAVLRRQGQHGDGHDRRLPPAVSFGRRNPLDDMLAAFLREGLRCALADKLPSDLAVGRVERLELEAEMRSVFAVRGE